MAEKNVAAKSRWERLDQYYKFCVMVILFVFAKDRVLNAFNSLSARGPNWEIIFLSFVLLVLVLVLVILWIKAVSDEMLLLKNNLFDYILKLPASTFPAGVGLSILLGMLAYFSDDIIKFSFIFAIFKLFEIWSIWLIRSRIEPAVHKAKDEVSEENRRANIIAIESYYLEKPHLPLAVTVLSISFLATILGLLGEKSSNLTIGAYLIMILAISMNEIIYAIWRNKRDAVLETD